MFCFDCGSQILENSKFCSFCGKSQISEMQIAKEQIVEKSIDLEYPNKLHGAISKKSDNSFLSKLFAGYSIWFVTHLAILLVGSDGIFKNWNMGRGKFWPFVHYVSANKVAYYDITEFAFYTLSGLAILLAVFMTRKRRVQ